MVPCASCEKPLICEECGAEFIPPTDEHYRALSEPGRTVECPECGEVLVCHWCKTPYAAEDEERAGGG